MNALSTLSSSQSSRAISLGIQMHGEDENSVNPDQLNANDAG